MAPDSKSIPLLLESGHLECGPDELVFILPLKNSQIPERAELQYWKNGASERQIAPLKAALNVIFPNLNYAIPNDVPFYPVCCPISFKNWSKYWPSTDVRAVGAWCHVLSQYDDRNIIFLSKGYSWSSIWQFIKIRSVNFRTYPRIPICKRLISVQTVTQP